MATRIIVGVTGAMFALFVIFAGPPVLVPLLLAMFCGFATFELLDSTKIIKNKRVLWFSVFFSALMPIAFYLEVPPIFCKSAVLLLTVYYFLEAFVDHEQMTFSDIACALFATALIPYLLTALQRIFFMENGKYFVTIPLIAAWCSDSFALFAGVMFGKHKLAPHISPKKTVEGAIGGVIGGALCMLLYAAIIKFIFPPDFSFVLAIVVGSVGAIIGQLGDLAFSLIKRNYGIKDYGSVFPGHGGVLDRFDSVILAAPAVEILLKIVFS